MKHFNNLIVFFTLLTALSFVCLPAFALAKVNLNAAPIEQLIELNGIGEKSAQKIIEYRKQKKFASVDELANVKGIGEKTLEKLRDQLTVEEKKN